MNGRGTVYRWIESTRQSCGEFSLIVTVKKRKHVGRRFLVNLPGKNTKWKSDNGLILCTKYFGKTNVVSNHSRDATKNTTSLGGTIETMRSVFRIQLAELGNAYAVEPVHSPAARRAKVTVRKVNNAMNEIALRRETILDIVNTYETKSNQISHLQEKEGHKHPGNEEDAKCRGELFGASLGIFVSGNDTTSGN